MTTAGPTIGVIQAQILAIRDKEPTAKVFGILASERWTGPTIQDTGSGRVAVYQCDSPLEMRLALQQNHDDVSATVLITPLQETEVSDDIRVRLAKRKLHPLKSWEIVRSLFKAKHLDPRITPYLFLADMLLEHMGVFPPVVGGVLDAETVWGVLLPERFGLASGHPDLISLLQGTAERDLAGRWKACTPEFRKAATAWIGETAGDAAGAILGCIEGEHGSKALSIGLAMGVVYHDQVSHELDKAAGRLEAYVSTTNLPVEVARRWRDAAGDAAAQLPKATLRHCVDEAETILTAIGAIDHAWRSDQLDSGFEQRLSRFGRALAAHVDARATGVSEELLNLRESILQHRLGRVKDRRMERVEMAFRLARWLADQNAGEGQDRPTGLAALARQYASDGGFVDWARRVLRGGEANKDLATAFVRLVDRVTELRENENQRFGQAVVDERAMGNADAGLIPVEEVLDRVVAKAAGISPVLVLVADGMSWAVFRELVADITTRDWIELGFGAEPQRLAGLAALPSVTEVCRTSLLCGSLRRGAANDEAKGFASHPALVAAGQADREPRLFHKAALEGDDDSSLAGDIRKALADRKQRVVGIVINAIDDHLDKGDQIDAVWRIEHIRVLEPILSEAALAGRLVILLSDHGHVLDRQTEGREATDGLRWRRPPGSPGTPGGSVSKGEFEVASPRVVMPDGGRVVVPWSERLRYGPKKNGYHGGVTPQEMLIPISRLWPERDAPRGMAELPPAPLSWWTEPTRDKPLATHSAPPAVALQPRTPAKATPPTLFDQPPVVTPLLSQEDQWISKLLASEIFAGQKRLAARVRVDEQSVQRLLTALASRGGSMTIPALAGAIAVPEHRLPGLLAIMQRLLNVEGYAILDRQDASNTVVLNVALAKKQFELD